MSSTAPRRPIGWRATKSLRACTGSAKALMRPSRDGVSTVPGHMALQRIPFLDTLVKKLLRKDLYPAQMRRLRCKIANHF